MFLLPLALLQVAHAVVEVQGEGMSTLIFDLDGDWGVMRMRGEKDNTVSSITSIEQSIFSGDLRVSRSPSVRRAAV